MKLKFSGVAPVQKTPGAAGLDLSANIGENNVVIVRPGEMEVIPTGTFVEIPEEYVGFLTPRSGLAARDRVTVLNSPGTIDSDYRGEIKVLLINHSQEHLVVNHGDRICQMVIIPQPGIELEEVPIEELTSTERGAGGFGSTGK